MPHSPKTSDFWSRFDTSAQRPPSPKTHTKTAPSGHFGWVLSAVPAFSLSVGAAVVVFLPTGLTREARIALFCFALSATLRAVTKLNAVYVALSVALLLVLLRGAPQKKLFESLASNVI